MLRTERLPAALTQGLRDFFGAHTYGRTDEGPSKKFHTQWSGDRTGTTGTGAGGLLEHPYVVTFGDHAASQSQPAHPGACGRQ